MRSSVLCVCFLLSSCAAAPTAFQAYSGVPRTAADIAKITTDSQFKHKVFMGLDDRVFIMSVDGRKTKGDWRVKYSYSVYVLPGAHKLRLLWGNGFYSAHGCLTVPTQAGHDYLIRQEVRGSKVFLWAVDEATDQSVTGTAKDASVCEGDA